MGTGGTDWEFGISRYKLLYIEWINNKVLLCGTGNYIQYPVINHNGKEYEKEYIHMCIYAYIPCVCVCVCVDIYGWPESSGFSIKMLYISESLCCTPETNTTL